MTIVWEKVVEFLVMAAGQFAVDAWRQKSAVDSSILNLQAALPKTHLLIERSECWRKYKPVDELLPQLKDAVYEAESVVHESEYQRLKNEAEKSFPGINFLRNWMSNFPTTVQRALDRLNNVYNEMKETCDSRGIPANPNQFSETARPITSTFLDTSNVYGRDEEVKNVIRLLGVSSPGSGCRKRAKKLHSSNLNIGESSSSTDNRGNVSVLSIVGMGGVGKTTLAQMVCNNTSVNTHFDLIMWVCVSDNFDLIRLTKEIIESATKEDCNATNLHALQVTLHETLKAKRFLLVLDDVWSKDWQHLLGPTDGMLKGSVVLVTTRSLQCVETAGTSICSRGVIKLESLEQNIYWNFFKSCAFDPEASSNNINPDLEVIGKEICDRLKGSPLAAKTIGGLLRTNMEVEYWRNIRDSKMWKLQQEEHDILPVLQLSYQYLPSYLKRCLSFCSLYPKDFKFSQEELIRFWIMQSFIDSLETSQELKVQAEGYFHELEKRSFFQKAAGSSFGGYVIHDLMHDVLQSITKDECFCVEDGDLQKIPLGIRHISIFQTRLKHVKQNELCKYKKLHSLSVAYPNSCCYSTIENWCNSLTSVCSLSLAKCNIKKLPESIGNLKHLQYLDISYSKMETLPKSFCCLYNLKYLNMEGCRHIECFPEGSNMLVNLQFFFLPQEKFSSVAHMENLATAIQMDHQDILLGTYQKIQNLKYMRKLGGRLRICNLEVVPSKQAAEEAQLNNKPLISNLYLHWYQQDGDRTDNQSLRDENPQEVLEGLCPHPNLKVLVINNYGGRNLSPSWLKEEFLPNLTEVHIEYCVNDFNISHLPYSITKLRIRYCNQLTNLQNCLRRNHLPVLKHMDISFCEKLESLPVELFGGFVSLESLEICGCSKLTCPNAMVLPPSLKNLELRSCGDLEKSLPSCLQNLTSLETLGISQCQNLVSIPAEVTSNLKSLSELIVGECEELQSLGGIQFLASLQQLSIQSCPKLEETGGQDILGRLSSDLLSSSSHGETSTKRARN